MGDLQCMLVLRVLSSKRILYPLPRWSAHIKNKGAHPVPLYTIRSLSSGINSLIRGPKDSTALVSG